MHCNFANDVVDVWVAKNPGQKAIVWADDNGVVVNRTYAEVSAASCRVANLLRENGVAAGETLNPGVIEV